jgi:hypothetical protein
MWVIALGVGCVPHVDVGEIPVERAARPVRIAAVYPTKGPLSVVVRVGLGSGDDPVGREGLAAALVSSLGVDAVELDPGATWFRCEGSDCAARLGGLVAGPGPRKAYVDPESFVSVSWRATVFSAHPLGRPAVRASVANTLADAEIASMYRRFFVRENVVAVVSGPDPDGGLVAALGHVFGRLPTALPPDRVRVRPIPAAGPRLVAVESAPSWRLGQALGAVPSAEEAEALWVYGYVLGDRSDRPTADAPWFAVDGATHWRDAWMSTVEAPSEAEIADANVRARASASTGLRARWAADDLAMNRPIRDPLAISVTREAVLAARDKYLSPGRWTLSVGDAQPESVRKLFLEGATSWFVQPGIERPTATRVIAEELYR